MPQQDEIKSHVETSYYDFIRSLILFRFQVIIPIGIVLFLGFSIIDRIAYPSHAPTFLKIRLMGALTLFILLLISFLPKIKPHVVWLADAGASVFIITVSIMVLISNGSSSRYYEGENLVIIGLSIVNPFYLRHLISCYLLWMGLYEFAMIDGQGPFNPINFAFANYFMSSTAFLVTLIAIFYKDQHYTAFMRQEQLKINEETLGGLYKQADKLSKTDTLTEINNRRYFFEILDKKIKSCETDRTSFYLVIFDVDHFKEINDHYGHPFGDKVLVQVVKIVKDNIRGNDIVGRFGGDEFIIICLDHPAKEGILKRLIKINDDVKTLGLTHHDKEVRISISIGAAKFLPGTNMTKEQLVEKADAQLLKVKSTTRGEISVNE